MKRLVTIAAALAALIPYPLEAGCRVQCQTPFVVTSVATVQAVPVAVAGPVAYTYVPQQPVNVTVNLNTDQIAQAVVDKLNGPAPQNTPPLPAPPPIPAGPPTPPPVPNAAERASAPPGAIAANCLGCHSPGHNAAAVSRIDLTQPLTCEQRLACARAVLSTRMPKGKTLDATQAGAVLEELVGTK